MQGKHRESGNVLRPILLSTVIVGLVFVLPEQCASRRAGSPGQAADGSGISDVEVIADRGFQSGSILGQSVALRVHNTHEEHELSRVKADCTFRLKNGEPAEVKTLNFVFKPRVPPRSSASVTEPLDSLKYHPDDYLRGSGGVTCETTSRSIHKAPRPHAYVEAIDSKCNYGGLPVIGSAQIQLRNKSDRTIGPMEIKCWNGVGWRTLTNIYRRGAPLNEMLLPNSTEWLEMDRPCLNDSTTASSCRVSNVRSHR